MDEIYAHHTGQTEERVHADMADPERSVLIVVDANARALEIVTGSRSGRRIDDEACAVVAASIGRVIGEGHLVRALVSGLQQLGQIAGPPRRRTTPTADPVESGAPTPG